MERKFSKSGKVTTWARDKMNTGTISEIMMFKNFFDHNGSEWGDLENSSIGIVEESVTNATTGCGGVIVYRE